MSDNEGYVCRVSVVAADFESAWGLDDLDRVLVFVPSAAELARFIRARVDHTGPVYVDVDVARVVAINTRKKTPRANKY